MHYAHQHLAEQPSHSAPLPDVYIVVSTAKLDGIWGMRFYVLFYYATSGGSLEFAFVFVSVVFAFAECGMWNVDAAMVVFPQTRCEFISFEKESCF